MDWNKLCGDFTSGNPDEIQATFSILTFIVAAIGAFCIAIIFKEQRKLNQEQQNLNRLATERDRREYLSSPKDFNDPFDCRIPENFYLLDTPEKIQQYIEGFMERQTRALLAHGEDPNNHRAFLYDKLTDHLDEFQSNSEKFFSVAKIIAMASVL